MTATAELLPDGSLQEDSLQVPGTSRVDRLLQERIRRNRSHQQFDYDEAAYEGPLDNFNDAVPGSERLVVVANRLPVTCIKDAQGQWQLQVSAGGLVSALKGVSTYKTVWIGWPGIWVKPGKERDSLTRLLKEEGCVPVWVEPTLLDMYYNGFCNSVLWQLFHYVPLNIDSWLKMSEHKAMQMQWQAYQLANQKFADVVLENYEPNDIMWVQDYHLMLLPSLLKVVVPKMKVGFFLHTPFPSSEMYRTLPVREEVLRAVLGADLIGFHTYDYARHFISSCTRILGLEGTPEGVENNGMVTRVGTFPIGIDPERFTRALETDEVQSHVAKLLNRYAGRKIMLGVDRLDMVKGIPQKLLAFEKFLEEHPEWRDKVLLVQIAVPSRTDVPEYQKLRSMVHEIVGRINGAFGTLTYVPIYHLDTSLSFTELCALYAVTDVALVTSLRDGMNLVSYEYVACQSDNAGVLVLSEFAGAAQSLGAGAILVNPWNISDMAQAIEDALCMSEEERRERHRQNYMHVQTHTAQNWADTFISELNDTHIEADLRMRHAPPPLDIQEVVNGYKNSTRRLIVLGYNATLTTHIEPAPGRGGGGAAAKRQHDLLKNLAKPNPRVLSCIQELCQDPCNIVAIFSGSDTGKLEDVFGDYPVWLAAENGVFVRPPPQHVPPSRMGKRAWRQLFDGIHREWMESVQLVFDYFCERTPRSFVEVRETSLVWNYKHADVEFGRIQARDLLQHLWTGPISNAPVEIIQGGKSVEVRPVGVTKGTATLRMVQFMQEVYGTDRTSFDFVLCIGHLLGRDENMFSFFEGHRVDGSVPASHTARTDRNFSSQNPNAGPVPPVLNLQQQAQLQMQQQAMAAGAIPNGMITRASGFAPAGAPPQDPFRAMAHANMPSAASAAAAAAATQLQWQQHHLAAQQAQHPELYARLQAAAVARAAAAAEMTAATKAQLRSPDAASTATAADTSVQSSPSQPAAASTATATPAASTAATTPQRPAGAATTPAALSPAPPQQADSLAKTTETLPHIQTQQKGKDGSIGTPLPGMPADPAAQPVQAPSPGPSTAVPVQAPSPGPSAAALAAAAAAGPGPHGAQGASPRSSQTPRRGRSGASGSQYSPRNGGLNQALQQYLDSNHDQPPITFNFPPRFCFTCTVGRNRSKARYALGAASEVASLLDAIVQQAIYHRDAPSLPHPHDLHLHHHHGMSRVDSYSSTEPLSPDSMFTLISNWKNYRSSGVLTGQTSLNLPGSGPGGIGGGITSAGQSAPDLTHLAAGHAAAAAAALAGMPTPSPGGLGRRSKSGVISPSMAAAAGAGGSGGGMGTFSADGTPSSMAGGVAGGGGGGSAASSAYQVFSLGSMGPDGCVVGVHHQRIPEDPDQEELVSAHNNVIEDHTGGMGGVGSMGRGGSSRHVSGGVAGASGHLGVGVGGGGGVVKVGSAMFVGEMDLGPSVSEAGSPPRATAGVVGGPRATEISPQSGHVQSWS